MNFVTPFQDRLQLSTAWVTAWLLVTTLLIASTAHAGTREQAKRMHDRVAGVPPQQSVLDQMVQLIDANSDPLAAAALAMDNPAFYTVTLKNLVTPWTNRDQSQFEPLNDYTATVIGMVRDDMDFRQVLSGNIIYVGNAGPAYSATNNDHYEALERSNADLSNVNVLQQRTQSEITGLPANATAGIMTTRAAAKAFFIDGTNRAMFRFTLLNHLCHDLEQVKDITRPPDRIRQDVSRSPGGDSRIFLNNCIGCHSGMDPLAQAFAYYNFAHDVDNDPEGEVGQLEYTAGTVQPKYSINNSNFKYGFVTPNDRWDNYWRTGANNKRLGWAAGNGFGNGAKSLGTELANSEAFAQCHSRKVFKTVCLREPNKTELQNIATNFKNDGYKLKSAFAQAAVACMGD